MIKYFCDICEKEADAHDYKLPFTFRKGTYWCGNDIRGFLPINNSMQPYTSHLCPHCANLIERFINGMKGEKNE